MMWSDLDRWKQTRARTVAMVSGLAQEQVDRRPAPGKWSVGEQLDHLLLADRLYKRDFEQLIALAKAGRQPEISRSMDEINFRPRAMPEAMVRMLEVPFTIANLFVPSGMREFMIRNEVFAGQRPDVAEPASGKPLGELIEALHASIREADEMLRGNADLPFARMVVAHPLLGRSNVPLLVRLVRAHEMRHQRQIGAILAAA
ncbi:MAG: DinB family protein [Bryobacteraceae bacterium]